MAHLWNSRSLRRSRRVGPALALLAAVAPVPAITAALAAGPASAATTPGVTIDGGDYATAQPTVQLQLSWPAGATSAVVSNDAGFDAAGNATSVATGTTTVSWTLTATATTVGQAPAEDTVYVEFLGLPTGTVTDQASIMVDTSTPTLEEATLLPSRGPDNLIRLVAADSGSGIAAVQTSTTTSGGVTTTISPMTRHGYATVDTVISPAGRTVPREARVESASGVWSTWAPVTPELSALARPHGGLLTTAPHGAAVSLRGFDYQPLKAVRVAGKLQYDNLTFAPGAYSSAGARRTLAQMAHLGYNAVRVFINVNEVGAQHGTGLNAVYLGRVADFVSAADADGIRVLLCTGELPTLGGYMPRQNPLLAGTNAYYLAPADITAKEHYLADLVTGLRAQGAPLSDVLWELAGEQDWNNREAPLDLKSRVVATAAGRFNMASPAAKVAMENDNLLHWVNVESTKLHQLLPGSLVGVGIYAPSINKKRPGWTVRPGPLFSNSARNDFVDIHVYSNLGSQLEQMQSFGATPTRKVLVMGEFGAARSVFKTPAVGATGEVRWEQQSCHVGGLHLSGWLLWTWNSGAQAEYWTALDGGGAIEKAMAPVRRPNACA